MFNEYEIFDNTKGKARRERFYGLKEKEDQDAVIKSHHREAEEIQRRINRILQNNQDILDISNMVIYSWDRLREIARDGEEDSYMVVARNLYTPEDILRKLSENRMYPKLPKLIVKNPNTPSDVLARYSEDRDSDMRQEVAKHPNTPTDVLWKLLKDSDLNVRYSVALNRNASKEIFYELHSWNQYQVKINFAMNPRVPIEILIQLLKDGEKSIVDFALTNPRTSELV